MTVSATDFVCFLDAPACLQPASGGKGARLAELLRAGFRVPPGFVVTTAAWRAFIAANGLATQIAELERRARASGPGEWTSVLEALRALIEAGAMPADVARQIRAAYARLAQAGPLSDGGPPNPANPLRVAVRSSATFEDRAEASAAGQHRSFLNVHGEGAVVEAVKHCWESAWTDLALAYRVQRGGNPEGIELAVIVQQMVPADAAGVLFTVNPVTGDPNEIAINAAWGLGDAVVAGHVTPDALVVDKASGVTRLEVGNKEIMTVPAASGTTEAPVDRERRRRAVLSAEQVVELARLARDIEAHFDGPQDIEWAIAQEKVYVLQSRPVSGLPAAPGAPVTGEPVAPGDDDWPSVDQRPPGPFDLWTRAVLGEVWPQPVSPLMWSGIPVIIGRSIRYALRGLDPRLMRETRLVGRFYGRVYYNEGALANLFAEELGLPDSFVSAVLGSQRPIDRDRARGFRPVRFVQGVPFLLGRAVSQLQTRRALEALFPEIDRWVAEFGRQSLERLDDRALWAEFMVWVERFTRAISLQAEASSVGITAFTLLEWLMARWLGARDQALDLMGGLPDVYAAEMGPALWEMAQRLSALGLAGIILDNEPMAALARLRDMPAAGPVIEMLDRFLERHGHRCPNEGEWLNPRWGDAPELVIEIVAGYLRTGAGADPREGMARQRRRREEALAWAGARLDPVRRAVLRRVLASAQHGARLRDNGKYYYMKVAWPLRQIHVLFGKRWTARGWLEHPEDIFFLTHVDLERVLAAGNPEAAGLNLRRLVAERRKAFEFWSTVAAPEVIRGDGRPLAPTMPAAAWGPVLRGIAASGGCVRGIARIVAEPQEMYRLGPNDILVTRTADPGWTPIFARVAGVVLELGGQLSHVAIVAREYGLVAVVNVHDATRRIRDGELIVVDGTRGLVHLDASP